jgi:ubiquinol-cytochrome c reductase cytochrome b subunit
MPSFAKDLERPERNQVSVRELSLIVDWLRGQYFRADDEWPILPHDQAMAEKSVVLARITGNPRTMVVGAATDRPDSELYQAQRLFATNCAGCHGGKDEGGGMKDVTRWAPDLTGFGSREWLTAFLNSEHIKSARFFGNTRHAKGEMVGFVNDNLVELDDIDKTKLQNLIIALSAEAALPGQVEADKQAAADGTLEKGRKAMGEAFESSSCVDCHKFRDQGDLGAAPDLTGWASKDWLTRFITDPAHEAFYRETNDRMPSFGAAPEGGTKQPLLTPAQIDLLARLLRGEL